MKRNIFILGLLFVGLMIHLFYRKHYIEKISYCKVSNIETDFRPDAYVFIHSEKKLHSFYRCVYESDKYMQCCNKMKMDFTKYSYLVVFGAKINKMYYSYKTTMFDDPSPSYAKARRYGKRCVFVVYDKASKSEKGVYFYRLKRDTLLRGFDGL